MPALQSLPVLAVDTYLCPSLRPLCPPHECALSLLLRALFPQVILTPGKDCHAAEPGFFRLCFAWMPPKALPEAVRRIKLLMGGGANGGGSSECSVQ